MKKLSKMVLSFALVLFIVLGLMPATEAKAANKGPNPNEYGYPYILVTVDETDSYIFAPTIPDVKEKKVKGVTYDKKKNTLTLNNYQNSNARIICNSMGDDFKINIKGNNKISQLVSWGYMWGGNLYLTGSGTLEINKNKKYYSAVVIKSEETASSFKVGKSVTLKAYAASKDDYSVVIEAHSLITKKSKAIIFENGASTKKVGMFDEMEYLEDFAYVEYINENDEESFIFDQFYILEKEDDPSYYVALLNDDLSYTICWLNGEYTDDGFLIAEIYEDVNDLEEAGYRRIVSATNTGFVYKGNLTLKPKTTKKK